MEKMKDSTADTLGLSRAVLVNGMSKVGGAGLMDVQGGAGLA